MRPTRLRDACAMLGVAVALGLSVVPQAARAGDDSSSSLYKATFGRLLEGFGFKSADDNDEINYRERAPLVIPPTANLPPPEKTSVVSNPAWPKDPDVTRREMNKKMEKNRDIEAERMREENPLPPDQLAPGPRPRSQQASSDGYSSPASGFGNQVSPSELGYKGGLFSKMFKGKNDDVARFTGEPVRTELTEPPPGYQTPSPDQPYGTGQAPPSKADNDYLHRGELTR